MNGLEEEYKEIAEIAEKEINKCYIKASEVINRALNGRITIIDKNELRGNEIIEDEYIQEKLNDLLDNSYENEEFIISHIYLKCESYKQGEEEFEIFYPRNSPFYSKENSNGLFNINVNIIDSVSLFVKKIIESKSDIISYYRGQGRWDYDMEPGIYRKNRKAILERESFYIREIVSMYPQYFKECKSALDYLSVLQHNGFPTRLLDFTENPLVALYMACCSEEETHADVIELKVSDNNIKYYDSDTVAILSNVAWFDDDICFGCKPSKKEFNEKMERLIHQIRNEKPYFKAEIEPKDLSRILFVKTKHSFERISRQSGLFALFGIKQSKLNRPEIEKMEGIQEITHYIIPHSLKKRILLELDCLGINQASLYCDLGNISKHYIENFPNKSISEVNKEIKEASMKRPF